MVVLGLAPGSERVPGYEAGLLVLGVALSSIIKHYYFDLTFISIEYGIILSLIGVGLAFYGFMKGSRGLLAWHPRWPRLTSTTICVGMCGKGRTPHCGDRRGHRTIGSAQRAEKLYQSLTAIVTVMDDRGSSGRIQEMGMLPPGDIRRCLVAMARTENLMDRVFHCRFVEEKGYRRV